VAKGSISAELWRTVCRLDAIAEELSASPLSPRARTRLHREQRAIESFLTPPRVSTANRWRRRIITIAMQRFPSMHLPTVTEFVALPEVQAVIQSDDAPEHWLSNPHRAVVSIRTTLVRAQFSTAPPGRPSGR
jgi:hypothetical protein